MADPAHSIVRVRCEMRKIAYTACR